MGYKGCNKRQGLELDFIDVRRAYFHAKARRDMFVTLPLEDWEQDKCGKLLKAMYGTRGAAQNWDYAYVDALEDMVWGKERRHHVYFPCRP